MSHPKLPRLTALPLLTWAGLGAIGPADAQTAQDTVRYALDYRAAASCPGEAAFVNLIARRTSRAVAGAPGDAKYRFTVDIALSDAGARGTLRITERDGAWTERDVPARDCASAVEAMALIAAVMLDPRAATTSPLDPSTPREAAPAKVPASTARGSPPRKSTEAPPRSAGESPASDRAAPQASKAGPAPSDGSRWQTRLRAAGVLQGGVAPGLAPGAAAGAELYRDRREPVEPRFALTAHFAAGSASTRFGDAELYWYAGRLTACPIEWPGGGQLSLRGCAFAEAGALHGRGSNTRNARSSTALWLAAGPNTELELRTGRWLALALEAGITVPAFHDRFLFAPEEEAHRVPPVSGWLAVGVRLGPL